MTTPEKDTAQTSGVQGNAASQPQQPVVTAPEKPTETPELPTYYSSDNSLKGRITELTKIAESGTNADVENAMKELESIEKHLKGVKEKPVESAPPSGSDQVDHPDIKGEAKKFFVQFNGERKEFDDPDSWLGHRNPGKLKEAALKTRLELEEHKNRTTELARKLQEADELIRTLKAQPQPATPAAPQAPPTPQPYLNVQRPVPPERPKLSTTDPDLYSAADIKALGEYDDKVNDFNKKIVDYVAALESRPAQTEAAVRAELAKMEKWIKENDDLIKYSKSERARIEEEKLDNAHWKRFTDFQNKHKVFETPVEIRKMNDIMNSWMDSVAFANGIKLPQSGIPDDDYMYKRAQVIGKYLNGDDSVVKNAEGHTPPEGHEAYFKMLQVNNAYKRFVDEGRLGKNAPLEDAYLILKAESGEFEDDLETIRTTERVNAAQQFANETQKLQQTAVNIDPSHSAGGPDVNELGIPSTDLKWFSSIKRDRLLDLKARQPDLYAKYQAIAAKIEEKFGR